jgi:hypothetical protein
MFDNYYPGGGWDDFAGDFDTEQEARECALTKKNPRDTKSTWAYDIAQVVDTETQTSKEV